jgi:electron transfer flavoprotein beta subunit
MQGAVSIRGRARIARDGLSLAAECLEAAPNPVDFVALEKALDLRESGLAATVTCMAAGAGAEAALAQGLAMGADRIVGIDAPTDIYLDARVAGRAIAAALAGSAVSLVFVAGESSDGSAEVVPHEIAAALDAACLTNVMTLKLSDHDLEVERRLEQGRRETWGAAMPAVVAFDGRANDPRYVTVAALTLARRAVSAELAEDDVRAGDEVSGAATVLRTLVTPRIRTKRVAGQAAGQSVSERMRTAVSGGVGEVKSREPLSGPPALVAERIVAFLRERGLLGARR